MTVMKWYKSWGAHPMNEDFDYGQEIEREIKELEANLPEIKARLTRCGNLCSMCKHFHVHNRAEFACNAFPEGIPEPILRGKADHTNPYPGDNGILFEMAEDD